ncbi:MAG: hypothetical protein EXS37_07335 [Opitutus sp.]|nr:hypothetical protein [Opitutus sp.]
MPATASRPGISIVRSMKRFSLTPHLASATLILALHATFLPAQENAAAPAAAAPAAKPSQRMEELMKRFDQDGDGKLDDAERAAAKEAMMKEPIDVQVLLAPPESPPGPAASGPEVNRKRMLAQFDQNKDGRLDEEERAAAKKFMAERGGGPGGKMHDEMIKRFDKNGNGKIDEDERGAVQEFMKKRRRPGAGPSTMNREADEKAALDKVLRSAVEANAAQLQRFDEDKDGRLSDQEWTAARKKIGAALGDAGPAASGAPEEKRRMDSVATEVERRRKQREKSAAKPIEPAK